MPWCDTCDKLVESDELSEGHCPTCETDLSDKPRGPLPWRFRFMIAATVIYLGWRIVQMVGWLTH